MFVNVIKHLFPVFAIWVLLSTTLPQFLPQIASSRHLPLELQNKQIQLLIAHPDDEVMFFGPSIIELTKPQYGNTLFVTCLSNGNDQGLGQIREQELKRSLEIMGIGAKFEIVDDETRFKDSMELEWDSDEVLTYVREEADVILTFDDKGISSHPNHISMYKAAIKSDKIVYVLKSWNVLEKYSWVLYTNAKLLVSSLEAFIPTHLNDDSVISTLLYKLADYITPEGSIDIYTDLPGTVLIASAMMNAHESQMVWFRYGWIFSGRYFNSNELVRLG